MSESIASAPAAGRLSLRLLRDAWRSITPRMVLVAFLLACAYHVIGMLTGYSGRPGSPWPFLAVTFVAQQIKAFILLFAFVVADRVTGGDPDRRGTYAVAVVVAALVASPVIVAWIYAMAPYTIPTEHIPEHFPFGMVRIAFFDLTMFGGAIVWVVIDRRRAARAQARLRAAEVARVEAARRSVESQLQALQARVEPQFLFDTLADVKRLHQRDPARAAQMLDDLITYLRAAMPKMRESSSTVARELDLVRAWLAIVGAREHDGFVFSIACPPALGAARLPPMMLLPLVDDLLDREPGETDRQRSLALAVDADDARLQVAVRARGMRKTARSSDADALADVRARLAALYGERGSLVATQSTEGIELQLAIPRETADDTAHETARGMTHERDATEPPARTPSAEGGLRAAPSAGSD